jgi:23S rRNA (cytidine2498-2'-O)-methyltransferase
MSLSSDGIRLIVTTQSGSESYAANELAALGLRPAAWLEDGMGLFAGAEAALAALRGRPPIFVRHVFGVQTILPLAGGGADAIHDDVVRAALALAPRLALDESFAVQIRAAGPGAGAGSPLAPLKGEIARAAIAELEALGYRQDARHPARVLSIYCAETAVYLGVSPAADNLSEWNGGMHRFATRPEQISRAEFKLLEALDVFGVALPSAGVALDLGAAPGGWTRLLRERGLRVVAVDPPNSTRAWPAIRWWTIAAPWPKPTCTTPAFLR